MHNSALVIVVKDREASGNTRLAEAIGDNAALRIYEQLLQHTHFIARQLRVHRYVYCNRYIEMEDIWSAGGFKKCLQGNGDTGEKLLQIFKEIFAKGYEHVVVIGADCIDLDRTHVEEAFHLLQYYDVVIGPAQYGGYYLLGMRQLFPFLFSHKAWSTPLLLQQTLDDLDSNHIFYHLLPVLSDSDEGKEEYLMHHRQ
ncbi:TIGR04282 family arsenosugar biosynthesis glycosyltransferase [Deminuibacter soli]|nr:TIGR04282 family arsenosugar biosynthesis glycosyltransferase [Deminuibacter soli]